MTILGIEQITYGVTDLETCRRLVADIVSERGRIDVWVNGFVAPEPGERLDEPRTPIRVEIRKRQDLLDLGRCRLADGFRLFPCL